MNIQHNLQISFGSEYLNNINAYFLGALLTANEPQEINDKVMWLAPYRHNYSSLVTEASIVEHIEYIKRLIQRSNGKILSKEELRKYNWFPPNKQGFAVAFESPLGTTIGELVTKTAAALASADKEILRCFLVGAFDGRASLDYNAANNTVRYLSLDCSDDGVANLLNDILQKLGIEANYNTARERVEGGRPRKNQFRIPSRDVEYFIKNIGMICPSRFSQIKGVYSSLYENQEFDLLYGLKTLANIEHLYEEPQSQGDTLEEYQAEKELIDDINDAALTTLEDSKEFEYSGIPQKKEEPIVTNGRKVYKRDKKKAMNALKKAHYKCECDATHPTFIRKNSSLPYTEPHHLVPLGFSDEFSVSLDVEENIVSLCSNCHNQLHYGRDIREILNYLYCQRKDLLAKVGIVVTINELYKMYNV